jgi:hypothetical protein
MPGRNDAGNYRFGMNTQEKEIEAGFGVYTAQFWEYNSRLGRRWNLDPNPQINISDYASFMNNPVLMTDHLGDIVDKNSYGGHGASRKERRQIRREINWERKNIKGFEQKFQDMVSDPTTLFIFENNFTLTSQNQEKVINANAIGPTNMIMLEDHVKVGNKDNKISHYKMGYVSRQVQQGKAGTGFSASLDNYASIARDEPDWNKEINFKMKLVAEGTLQINISLFSGYKAELFVDGKSYGTIFDVYQAPSPTGKPGDADPSHYWLSTISTVNYKLENPKLLRQTDVKIVIRANENGADVHAPGYLVPSKIAKLRVMLTK